MASGCYVIGSDAGNIPYIMGGLGTMFPAGDVSMLREAIEAVCRSLRGETDPTSGGRTMVPTVRGPMPLSDWRRAVGHHIEGYTLQRYEERFLTILEEVLTGASAGPAGPADSARQADVLNTGRRPRGAATTLGPTTLAARAQ